jgi:hypothetical protein
VKPPVLSAIKDASTRGTLVVFDSSQIEQFAIHAPPVPANALGEREIAEILVVEVDFTAVRGDLTAHQPNRESVLTVPDLELETVLERVPGLGETSNQCPCSFVGARRPLAAF